MTQVGFKGGREDIWVDDCLNVGVSPQQLIERLRRRFEAAGGVVLEHTSFRSAEVGRRRGWCGCSRLLPAAPGCCRAPGRGGQVCVVVLWWWWWWSRSGSAGPSTSLLAASAAPALTGRVLQPTPLPLLPQVHPDGVQLRLVPADKGRAEVGDTNR
jgi:hypothetical protein